MKKTIMKCGISAVVLGSLLAAGQAFAHGYISSPKSRYIQCAQNGIENPTHPACIAAKAAGNGGLYTPQEVAVGGVKDNHEFFIPDGRLCSANRSNLFGMDLARTDWPATSVTPGPRTFTWTNTAAHKTTYFRYYITKEGYNHSQPLRWSDLVLIHDSGKADQEAVSNHVVNLPQRTGRHIVYSIWQLDWEHDAAEGFYQCVDVDFGGGTTSSVASSSSVKSSSSVASSVASSVVSSSVSNDTCASLPAWNASTSYTNPQQVKHNNKRYQANYWTQGNDPTTNSGQYSYWLDLGACTGSPTSSSVASSAVVSSSSKSSSSVAVSSSVASSVSNGNCTSPAYVNGSSYANGAKVTNVGNEYQCTVAGWCSVGGPYAPGTGWAWANAWSLVRACN